MHDIDKTLQEFETIGSQSYQNSEYDPETEFAGSYPSEEYEVDLANELLSTSTDSELDNFFGKMFKKMRRSPMFKSAVNIFKGIAKQALPLAGKIGGQYFAGPAGGMVGGAVGQMGSNMFEINLEGLSNDDKEFEIAKGIVSFAKAAADKLSQVPVSKINGNTVKQVIKDTAQTFAPGLYKQDPAATLGVTASGRWVRKGDRIILYGV